MNKVEELVEWVAKEADRHHIGCNIKKECDSKCGECAALDIVAGLSEKFDLALIDREKELPKDSYERTHKFTDYYRSQKDMLKAGFTHSIIPLKEALELKNETKSS